MNVNVEVSEEAAAYMREAFGQTPEDYLAGCVADVERQAREGLARRIEAEEYEKANEVIKQRLQGLLGRSPQ